MPPSLRLHLLMEWPQLIQCSWLIILTVNIETHQCGYLAAQDVKERLQDICKNIYCWRCFIFSSAFHQSCGFITVHVPNIEYTPGFSLMVKKNHLETHKSVWVSVCTLRWRFTINIHTYSIKSHRIVITIKKRLFLTSTKMTQKS